MAEPDRQPVYNRTGRVRRLALEGGGVLAAASYASTTGQNGVFLLNASIGQLIKTISFAKSNTFAQPMFADNYLIVASTGPGLKAYQVPGT
jgi:hypothetical protein